MPTMRADKRPRLSITSDDPACRTSFYETRASGLQRLEQSHSCIQNVLFRSCSRDGGAACVNTVDPGVTALENHFTPQELAELWKFDESTIRRMFIDEPGVLKYGKQSRRDGRRNYVTLRIPESVARRVYERRTR
jgi:hypothetical protein